MINLRWLFAVPIVVAAFISTSARGSAIEDRAAMFSKEAVTKAQSHLDRLEHRRTYRS